MTRDEQQRLVDEVAYLRKEAAERRRAPVDMPVEGCGDNSCEVRHPGGMATNGGCRCSPREVRRALRWWRRRAAFLEETVRELRAMVPRDPE